MHEFNQLLDKMVAFENGELDEDDAVALMQYLVDIGMVWSLQGFYGRTAISMIEAGLIVDD